MILVTTTLPQKIEIIYDFLPHQNFKMVNPSNKPFLGDLGKYFFITCFFLSFRQFLWFKEFFSWQGKIQYHLERPVGTVDVQSCVLL